MPSRAETVAVAEDVSEKMMLNALYISSIGLALYSRITGLQLFNYYAYT